MSASCNRGSNCSLTWAVDGRIVRCGIISSCQSAATSEIVKRFWSRTRVRNARTSVETFTFTLLFDVLSVLTCLHFVSEVPSVLRQLAAQLAVDKFCSAMHNRNTACDRLLSCCVYLYLDDPTDPSFPSTLKILWTLYWGQHFSGSVSSCFLIMHHVRIIFPLK